MAPIMLFFFYIRLRSFTWHHSFSLELGVRLAFTIQAILFLAFINISMPITFSFKCPSVLAVHPRLVASFYRLVTGSPIVALF